MATNRDFDLVIQKANFGETDIAIRLLVGIIKQQQKQIEVLQNKLEGVTNDKR